MKAVLVGTDLMYRADGKLVPIEINTNVGVDETNRIETWAEVFDLEQGLVPYIQSKNIKKIVADGAFALKALPLLEKLLPEVECVSVPSAAMLTAEDEEGTLFVRSAYDSEAAVDGFCRDKVAFMSSIKDTDFAAPCISKISGEIREIGHLEPGDNGAMPTIINKCRYPHYNHTNYPKCFKYTSREQVEAYANTDELEDDHFLTSFNFSKEHLYEGNRIKLIRNWSVFIGEEEGIKAISVGNYTKISGEIDFDKVEASWNEDGTSSLDDNGRFEFIVGHWGLDAKSDLLLEEGDLVWMADGSWKAVESLTGQEEIKTLKVPVGEGVDIRRHIGDYNVTLDEWREGSEYENILGFQIVRRVGFRSLISIRFADGSDWRDTENSSYPTIDPEDGTVVFKLLSDIVPGDKVIMVKYQEGENTPVYEEREVVEVIEESRDIVEGYGMYVDGPHIFMTRISSDAGAYISIEHNLSLPGLKTECTENNCTCISIDRATACDCPPILDQGDSPCGTGLICCCEHTCMV